MIQLTIDTPRFKYEVQVKEWPNTTEFGERMVRIQYKVGDNVVIKYLSTDGLDIDMRRVA
jgi:hypothetical protein